nr:hypothetical protein [Atopobium sp. oral taxon 810]
MVDALLNSPHSSTPAFSCAPRRCAVVATDNGARQRIDVDGGAPRAQHLVHAPLHSRVVGPQGSLAGIPVAKLARDHVPRLVPDDREGPCGVQLDSALILADIVYWYRVTEVRDEQSGEVVGMRKKFRADMLQRNTSS